MKNGFRIRVLFENNLRHLLSLPDQRVHSENYLLPYLEVHIGNSFKLRFFFLETKLRRKEKTVTMLAS